MPLPTSLQAALETMQGCPHQMHAWRFQLPQAQPHGPPQHRRWQLRMSLQDCRPQMQPMRDKRRSLQLLSLLDGRSPQMRVLAHKSPVVLTGSRAKLPLPLLLDSPPHTARDPASSVTILQQPPVQAMQCNNVSQRAQEMTKLHQWPHQPPHQFWQPEQQQRPSARMPLQKVMLMCQEDCTSLLQADLHWS